MTLPSFTANQSVYRNTWHYRSSPRAQSVRGITPSQLQFVPYGTYLYSCYGCTYGQDDTLFCGCLDLNRNLVGTSLPFASYCVGDISNSNGQLYCQYS
jgi:hypothetical protein